ncbi:MAG: hypothetical protein ABID84_02915 [Chloroflexota bacterium]
MSKGWVSKNSGERWGTMLLKGCPRCRGDLHMDRDFYGEYRKCIQCGYMEDLEPRTLQLNAAKTDRKAA